MLHLMAIAVLYGYYRYKNIDDFQWFIGISVLVTIVFVVCVAFIEIFISKREKYLQYYDGGYNVCGIDKKYVYENETDRTFRVSAVPEDRNDGQYIDPTETDNYDILEMPYDCPPVITVGSDKNILADLQNDIKVIDDSDVKYSKVADSGKTDI